MRSRASIALALFVSAAALQAQPGDPPSRAARISSLQGIASLAAPSLHDRLHQSVAFQRSLVNRLLSAKARGVGQDGAVAGCLGAAWSGRHLRISDSTSLSERASAGTDWRVHGVYDLGSGGFTHLELTDGHGGERLSRGRGVVGEVRIGDRGYGSFGSIREFVSQAAGSDVIVRLRWQGLRLCGPDGQGFDLFAFLSGLAEAGSVAEAAVRAQGPAGTEVGLRLLALRLPEASAAANRARLRRQASRKQREVDPRSLVAAGFVILATTLPAEVAAAEIMQVYRLRWQIELAFKRLKSLLHIARLPTWTEAGGQSWLYAHLILVVLSDDLSQQVLESFP